MSEIKGLYVDPECIAEQNPEKMLFHMRATYPGTLLIDGSRRIDGLYTRPYIACINSEGKPAKPFLLPQKDVDFYHRFMKSYNIPELVAGKVKQSGYRLSEKAINDQGIDVKPDSDNR